MDRFGIYLYIFNGRADLLMDGMNGRKNEKNQG